MLKGKKKLKAGFQPNDHMRFAFWMRTNIIEHVYGGIFPVPRIVSSFVKTCVGISHRNLIFGNIVKKSLFFIHLFS